MDHIDLVIFIQSMVKVACQFDKNIWRNKNTRQKPRRTWFMRKVAFWPFNLNLEKSLPISHLWNCDIAWIESVPLPPYKKYSNQFGWCRMLHLPTLHRTLKNDWLQTLEIFLWKPIMSGLYTASTFTLQAFRRGTWRICRCINVIHWCWFYG